MIGVAPGNFDRLACLQDMLERVVPFEKIGQKFSGQSFSLGFQWANSGRRGFNLRTDIRLVRLVSDGVIVRKSRCLNGNEGYIRANSPQADGQINGLRFRFPVTM